MSDSIFTDPKVKKKVVFVGSLSLLIIGIEFINLLLGHSLNSFGIHPGKISGLVGIVASPFLHGSMNHLLSNIGPFVVLSGFIIWRSVAHYIKISLFIMIATGLMVWTLAPSSSIIVGASGVIFGYFGYLISRACFERSSNDILIAILVMFFYGGMIFGVFPGTPGVSWESHLFGFISGFGAAWLWRKK